MNLPIEFEEKMQDLLGGEYNDYLKCYEEPRHYGLRVNTSKISIDRFLEIAPWPLRPIPWIENGFYYDGEKEQPAKHPYYFAGLYYIQEPSAMTPANVLPVEEGDIVFDMCAAPGGKSTELGAKLNGSGLLVTNDISNSRAKALLKNVEVFGIPNVYVVSEDPKNIQPGFNEFFDKILIDAPCSGEGMFRKDNKLIKSWEKTGPEFYAKIQRDIILTGADMLKPGGKMLYSTCTFSKLEDEETVRDIIQECFLRFWERREMLSAFSLTSLLFSMVRNGCLNYLKHRSIVEKYRVEYLAKVDGEERLYYADFMQDAEHKLLYKELQEQIALVLNQLPDRSREIFLLSRFRGLKNREIAEKLQISTTAVEKHIARALQYFSRHFSERYPVDLYIVILAWLMMEQK